MRTKKSEVVTEIIYIRWRRNSMSHNFLAFFSGFPNYRFPYIIGSRLREELIQRESLVFVSAWPDDYERNDKDSNGMYSMFEEYTISFIHHYVIDNRMEASKAIQLINEASCIFLMGGHPGLQLKLIREKELEHGIYNTKAAVLGVSAGAINMAKHSLDTKESPVPYNGLGLADITIKPHFKPDNQEVLSTLLKISAELPICASEDESAIFVTGDSTSFTGKIYWINKGEISPLLRENLLANNK